jgi:hypothetical protein
MKKIRPRTARAKKIAHAFAASLSILALTGIRC